MSERRVKGVVMVKVGLSVAMVLALLAGVACARPAPQATPLGDFERRELGLAGPGGPEARFVTPTPLPTPRPDVWGQAGPPGAPGPWVPVPPPGLTPPPPPRAAPTPTPRAPAAPPAPPPKAADQTSPLGQPWATTRLVIRTGSLTLVVESTPRAMEQIIKLAGDMGGYVVSSKMWEEGKKNVGGISIRVPAELYFDAIKALRALALVTLNEDSTSRDVTEEYVDLDSRLRHLQATEQQLLKMMEKAGKIEEALQVQKELQRIQGEIEQVKGRQQFLQRSSATSLISITLREAALEPQFTASLTKPRVGEEIKFMNRSSGGFPPYTFSWDLGDGTTSTEENPVHAYAKAGSYTVSLTLRDDRANTATITQKAYLTIQTMTARLSLSHGKAPVGTEVQFQSQVTGGFSPYSFRWDFGDGTTSIEESPTYAYPKAGTYTVGLTVTDDKGNTDTQSLKAAITILPMEAEFTVSSLEAPVGGEFGFTNRTTGGFPRFKYQWSFGDGATSDRESPRHTYRKPGTYSVKLMVEDAKGNEATESKENLVLVTAPPQWRPGGVWGDAVKALGTLGRGLATAGIWLAVFIPVWASIMVGLLTVRARNRRRPPPAKGPQVKTEEG